MSIESDGVWRTIGGKRIFIKKGENLETAMKKSGKFKLEKKENEKENEKEDKKETKSYSFHEEQDDFQSKQFNELSDQCQNQLEEKYGKQQLDEINKSMQEYVQSKNSFKINDSLRKDTIERLKNKEEIKKTISNMDKAIEGYQITENVKTVRFEDGSNLFKNYGIDLKKFNEDGNINAIKKSDLAKEFKNHVGEEYSSKAYTSVSTVEQGSPGFTTLPVRMEIDIPEKTNCFITKNKDEKEIILARNQKMILYDVDYEKWSSDLIKNINPDVADERGKLVLKYKIVEK